MNQSESIATELTTDKEQTYVTKNEPIVHPEILDNGSNTNIFENVSMITNLNNQHAIGINGVNGKSPLILNTSGEHSDWGETYINKDGVINIVSFSKQRTYSTMI